MLEQQAVLIHLDGTTLPREVYEQHDLATLENQLIAAVEREGLGEFDGNEVGPAGATLFLYGANADALFQGIEPVLRANPLCQNARVTIRAGGPGASETEVRITVHIGDANRVENLAMLACCEEYLAVMAEGTIQLQRGNLEVAERLFSAAQAPVPQKPALLQARRHVLPLISYSHRACSILLGGGKRV